MPKKKVLFVCHHIYGEQVVEFYKLLLKSWGYEVKAFFWEAYKIVREVSRGIDIVVSYDNGSFVQDALGFVKDSIPVVVIYTREKPEKSAPNLTLLQAPVKPILLKQTMGRLLK